MKIAALLFDKLTLLDIVGPTEVLSWVPGAEVLWVGKSKGLVRASPSGLEIHVDHALSEVDSADVLIVPGGPGVRLLLEDEGLLDWIRKVHAGTTWTTSVCTGSLLLGAAGLLEGKTATTHWAATGALESFGATYVEDRVVPQEKIVTSAGVSSGIDMALWLMGQIGGATKAQVAQLCIEYDPQPPFDAGAPSKAPAAVLEQARGTLTTVVQNALGNE